MCDDRAIRDSERQMAITIFEQNNQAANHNNNNHEQQFHGNNAVMSRVKSVTNIAKRSAGISEDENQGYSLGLYHQTSNRDHEYQEEVDPQQASNDINPNRDNTFYRSKSMQNLRDCQNNGNLQRQKSVHFNEVATYQDINTRSTSGNFNFFVCLKFQLCTFIVNVVIMFFFQLKIKI